MTFKVIETLAAPTRGLRSVEIGVTARCNFKCDYCGAYDLRERQVLSAEQVIAMLRNLPDLQRVKLSGGEVLLQFDICAEIIAYCSANGITTQVNSNGTLLDEERFQRLETAGLDILHLSLNHTDAASHARFYRVSERFFGRIVETLRRSVASPTISTVVETIVFNETKDTLLDVHRFAADLGVREHEIQMEIPGVHAGYASTMPREVLIDTLTRLVRGRDPRTTLYFSCLSAYFTPATEGWGELRRVLNGPGTVVASCIEGKSQLHVHSNGDVMICELGCPDVIGNVFQNDLQDLFDNNERLRAFVQSKHEEETFSCFRNCDAPGEQTRNEPVLLTLERRPSQ